MASESATISSNKIDLRFEALRSEGRKALICYLTAGHPDRKRSVELIRGLAREGADVIEVGVPFSDPIADGPVIQQSSQEALAGGMTLNGVLELIQQADVDVPIVLFSYLNPLLSGGDDILRRAHDCGVDGILVTDLPVGADEERERWLGESELAFIRLVAPTTPLERMKEISSHGSGFVYLISRLGVTGTQDALASDLPETAARLRAATELPICVGFGVSTAAHAAAAAKVADGVVVGSAIVRAASENLESAFTLVRSLRQALDT